MANSNPDLRSLKKAFRILKELKEDIPSCQEKITKKYQEETEKEFNYIIQSAVDKYYESYPERKYDPYGDLYNAAKPNITNKVWEIKMGPEFMKHHGGLNSYIFDRMFGEGWHGGADKSSKLPPHPHPGIPYWKKPPTYKQWLKPAVQTDSPKEEIEKRYDDYMDTIEGEMNKEYDNKLMPKVNELYKAVKNAFKRR